MTIKKLLLLLVTITFIMIGYGVAIPISEYLASKFEVGLYYTASFFVLYSLGQLTTAPFLGKIGDVFGAKKVMLISICGYIVSFIITLNVNIYIFIFIFRFFTGVFAGATVLTIESYIGEHSKEKNRVVYFTFVSISIAVGMILGPIVGIIIITNEKLISIIWAFIALILVVLLNKILLEFDVNEEDNIAIKDIFLEIKDAIVIPKNMYVFLGFLMLGIISSSLESIILIYLTDKFIFSEISILFVAVIAVFMILYVFFVNTVITQYINKKKYSMLMLCVTSVALFIMGITTNINILILGFFLLVLGLSSIISVMSTLITISETKNGMLFGIRNTILGLGAISGPILSAFLYSIYPSLFLFVLSFMCLLVVLYAYIRKIYY